MWCPVLTREPTKVAHSCNSSAGSRDRQLFPGVLLAETAVPGSLRDPVQKIMWKDGEMAQ